MSRQTNKLRFPSGRVKTMVKSRYEVARRVASASGLVKTEAHEQGAVDSLVSWGMVTRHAQTPAYVQWSLLHERPRFAARSVEISLYGAAKVGKISQAQHDLINIVAAAGAAGRPHRVLIKNCESIRRMIRSLERRGLLAVHRGEPGVWGLRIADTFPGKKPIVPAGTGAS